MNRFEFRNYKQSKSWRKFLEVEGVQTVDFAGGWIQINKSITSEYGVINRINLEDADISDLYHKAKELNLSYVHISPNDKVRAEYNGIKKESEKIDPKVSIIDFPHKIQEQTQQKTIAIDSSKTDEGLLEDLSKVSRSKLQTALKSPLRIIYDNSPEAFETFYKLFQKSKLRNELDLDFIDPQKIWKSIPKKDADIQLDLAIIYNPEDGDRPLESWLFGTYEGNCFVLCRGISEIGMEYNSSEFMYWEIIKKLKKNNNKYLCFNSFSEKDYDFEFKNNLGGIILTYQKPFDLIINPLKYRLANAGSIVKNKLFRKNDF